MAGTSYTRQSSLTDGDTITAALFNDEYNQLVNAFAYSSSGLTGHQHDGGPGEGGNIEIIGDQDFKNKIVVDSTNNRWSVYVEVGGTAVEQVRIEDGVVYPVTDSDVDLGTDAARFKAAYIDSITATTSLTLGTSITVSSILDEDDMVSNSATALATQQSIKAYVDAQVTAQDLDLTDGTTSISIDLDSEALSVLGGTGITSTASGNGVTLAIDPTVATLTGTQTLTNKTLTSPDVNDGTIDGTTIGATSASTGAFTTLTASGEITANGGIALGDNDKATFGAGSDLQIYHDGTDSYISDQGTGSLKLRGSSQIRLETSTGTQMISADDGGAAKLYHNGVKRLDTTATGIDVTGNVVASQLKVEGTEPILFFNDTTTGHDDWKMYADWDQFYIQQYVNDSTWTQRLHFAANGNATFTGEIVANGGIALGDNVKATFGAGDDLQIFHDGSNSYIADTGTGGLRLLADADTAIRSADNATTKAIFGGDVKLYHSGNLKLSTTATGIDVTGTATMDGLTVDSTTGFSWLPVSTAGAKVGAIGTGTGLIINTPSVNDSYGSGLAIDGSYASDLSSVNVKAFGPKFSSYGSELNLFTSDDTSLLKRQTIASNGDISFYEDTGTTAKLTWSAAGEDLNFADNVKATFGASDDLQIYHGGTHSYIKDSGTGNLNILASASINLLNGDSSDYMARFNDNGSNQFFYDGSQKLVTTATGIDVTGTATMDGLVVSKASGDIATLEGTTAAGDVQANLVFNPVYDVNARIVSAREGAALASTLAFETAVDNTGNTVRRQLISSNGDISFYEDTGTTAKFFWDASAESLKLVGSDAGTAGLFVESSTVGVGARLDTIDATLSNTAVLTNSLLLDSDNHAIIRTDSNNNGSGDFYITKGSSDTARMRIANNGDLSLYEDTGTTAKLFWDASAESLGIGTAAALGKVHIETQPSGAGITPSTSGDELVLENNSNCGLTIGTENLASIFFGKAADSDIGGIGYLMSDNSMRFTTNTAERMRIDSSGRVGIGTSTPNGKLTVSNGSGAHFEFFPENSTDTNLFMNYDRTSAAYQNLQTRAATHQFLIGDSERMRIDSSGNVGIGASSPSAKLAIETGTDEGIRLFRNSANANFGAIEFRNSTDTATNSRIGWNNNELRLEATSVISATTNGAERMRIDSSGYVTIGSAGLSADVGLKFQADTGTFTLAHDRGAHALVLSDSDGTGEVLRVDTSGNLLVGTTSQISGAKLQIQIADIGAAIKALNNGNWALGFYNSSGSNVGNVVINASSTSYNTSSDQRLKENIADADDAGSKIDAIQVRKYDWKADGSHQDYGMIAQELQAVAPEAVSGDADSEEMMGVDYSKLVPMLIKEIQSLRNRVAQLEA